jgi:putative endonuclease
MSVYYVYILETTSKEGITKYYTGYTNNLYKRWSEHRKGVGAKFCRGKKKILLKYFETFMDRTEAMKRELEIKSFSRLKKEELIKNFNNSDKSG